MATKREKVRAQVKSRWYYIFWGSATVAVVSGQWFVGAGFRSMSKSLDTLVDSYVNRPRVMPVPNKDYGMTIIR